MDWLKHFQSYQGSILTYQESNNAVNGVSFQSYQGSILT